jgi:hypothetical protein
LGVGCGFRRSSQEALPFGIEVTRQLARPS